MDLLGVLAAVGLLAGNAFFVAAEFAAVSARRAQIEPLAERSRRARRTLDAQRKLSLLLAGAQLGITLCSLGLGAVAEPSVAHLLEKLLHALQLPAGLSHPLAFVVALTLVVLAHMVLGEMVPKNLALARAERSAVLLVPTLASFVRVMGAVLRGLNGLANGALRMMRVTPQEELKTAYTAEELADILAESRHEGLLAAGEHDRLARALQLHRRTAADVAVPLARLVTVPFGAGPAEVEAASVHTGYSRFPLADPARPGRLTAYVHVKDVLTGELRRRPMPPIAADAPLSDVLATLRRARSHLAAVVGPDGTFGAIALEDVLEEITGEISDAAHRGSTTSL